MEECRQDHDTYSATPADLATEDQNLPSAPRLTSSGTRNT